MNNTLMFRKVEISPILEKSRESTKNKGFYITKIQNFNMYKFLWFKEYWWSNYWSKRSCIIRLSYHKNKELRIFVENDDFKWYDVLSLGIIRTARNTKKYNIYIVHIYKVCDKEISSEKIFDRVEFW